MNFFFLFDLEKKGLISDLHMNKRLVYLWLADWAGTISNWSSHCFSYAIHGTSSVSLRFYFPIVLLCLCWYGILGLIIETKLMFLILDFNIHMNSLSFGGENWSTNYIHLDYKCVHYNSSIHVTNSNVLCLFRAVFVSSAIIWNSGNGSLLIKALIVIISLSFPILLM